MQTNKKNIIVIAVKIFTSVIYIDEEKYLSFYAQY
jgi:hypothetical protein